MECCAVQASPVSIPANVKALLHSSDEALACIEVLGVFDATSGAGRQVAERSKAILVRHRARPAESALLIVGQRPSIFDVFGGGIFSSHVIRLAVPICTSVTIHTTFVLGDCASAANLGAPGGRNVILLLSAEAENELEQQMFCRLLQQLSDGGKQHAYVFPSSSWNHDWLWSYGLDSLPEVLRFAPPGKPQRSASLVWGGVHLRSLLSRSRVNSEQWSDTEKLLQDLKPEYCESKSLTIRTVTLNCGGAMPPNDSSSLSKLFCCSDVASEDSTAVRVECERGAMQAQAAPDILVAALQETCPLLMAVDLTETVTAGHHAAWSAAICQAAEAAERFAGRDGGYSLVADRRLVGLQILVLVREGLKDTITDLRGSAVRCGTLGAGNKGVVAVSFCIFATSVCFVNCHLAAGEVEDRAAERWRSFRHVLESLRFEHDRGASSPLRAQYSQDLSKSSESELDADWTQSTWSDNVRTVFEHDLVIWAGDTNSRLWADASMQQPLDREHVLEALGSDESLNAILESHDELYLQRRHGALALFQEAPVRFAPTYKFEVRNLSEDSDKGGHRTYDTKRTPAFTDRILWRARNTARVEPLDYEAVPSVEVSDHRPVRLGLRLEAQEVHWKKLRQIIETNIPSFDDLDDECRESTHLLSDVVYSSSSTLSGLRNNSFYEPADAAGLFGVCAPAGLQGSTRLCQPSDRRDGDAGQRCELQ
eukprot:TRINITY_DN25481_c0_g1_i1.p1 TRINITY_DN25481_c0_g1~~TRINITY_DN25481_c0_g1_i1.p1  ORF type:complete len:710 (-),score=140.03 TRINITY_DN25481_c0_g1_i1:31-2160(-)